MKPIDAIIERLLPRVRRDPSGAASLAHVLVVAPTAQSGRRLRLALATRLGALVPPQTLMPMQLFAVDDPETLAGRTDEILAFRAALGADSTLEVAAQYADLRGILGAGALTFADVAERIGQVLTDELADVEAERWRKLAELEARYLEALAARGKTDRIVHMRKLLDEPPHLPGVETVVLAYLLDPMPAARDLIGRICARDNLELEAIDPDPALLEKTPELRIVPCATAAGEAERVAELFASVKPEEALPSLCVADSEAYPEMQGTLQTKGVKIHDPSRIPLSGSSLGQLVQKIAVLTRTRSYSVFSSFIRTGDVRRWLKSELGLADDLYSKALAKLDKLQRQLLPSTLDHVLARADGDLRRICVRVDEAIRQCDVTAMLQSIFAGRILDERDADAREFAAAAEVVVQLVRECLTHVPPTALDLDLFSLRLRESSYSLEADDGDSLPTDGWLELPFVEADEVCVTGFNEGIVPESVVGHVFLPDRLRRGLGLPDNEARFLRDRTILRMVANSRQPGAVRIFFRVAKSTSEALKPSRLLFDGVDDATLLKRVKNFYKNRTGAKEMHSSDLPEKWKLQLDVPPERQRLDNVTVSSLENYATCPFTWYLKELFGEKLDDRAEELDSAEFGSIVHKALEKWGNGDLRDSDDADQIAGDLIMRIDDLLAERFGGAVPAIVALQGESAKNRMRSFAKEQAARRREGWRIVSTERKMLVRYEVDGEITTVNGKCDRIDFNENDGRWCVIDYKTYDKLEKKAGEKKSGKTKTAKQEAAEIKLQLPLYCAMLDADPDFPDAHRSCISACYLNLGPIDKETGFAGEMNGEAVAIAEPKVREAIGRIRRGIFWPPVGNGKKTWKYDFKDWIYNTPEESVSAEWIRDQQRRIDDLEGSHEG